MKICPACGHQSDDLSTFCTECGKSLIETQAEVEAVENIEADVETVEAEIVYQPEEAPQPVFEADPQPEEPAYSQPAQQFAQPQPNQFAQPNQQFVPNGFNPNGMGTNFQTPAYFQFKDYADKMKGARTSAIIGLIFSLGYLGIVLAIISLVSVKKGAVPQFAPSTPEEFELLENAKKYAKTARTLSFITIAVFVVSFLVGFVAGLLGG